MSKYKINYISNSQYIANNKNGGTITGDCSLNYTKVKIGLSRNL